MEAAQLLELGMYMSWKGLREFLPLSLKANVTAETGQATTLNPKPSCRREAPDSKSPLLDPQLYLVQRFWA